MNRIIATSIWTACVLILAGGVSHVQGAITSAPILEYNMNEGSGTVLNSTGTDTTDADVKGQSPLVDFWKTNAPSGLAGDASGNFGISDFMRATHAADNDNIDGLTSFTITGWFNNEGGGASGQVLMNQSGTDGFKLQFRDGGNAGKLLLNVDGSSVSTTAAYGDTNTSGTDPHASNWIYFAVSYDGTQTSNNVVFYEGDNFSGSPAAAAFETLTLNQGAVANDTQPLIIGKESDTGAGFNFEGYLDNIRIFGDVLTLSEVEEVRAADVNNSALAVIPTPAALPVGLGLLTMLAMRRRRA